MQCMKLNNFQAAMISSKRSPLSCVLNLLTVKPALEKQLSEEAGVAGMQNHFEASCFE